MENFIFVQCLLVCQRTKSSNIYDQIGIKLITRKRLGFRHFFEDKFRHAFEDIVNPL